MKQITTDKTPGKKREPTAKDSILVTPLYVPVVTPYKNEKNEKNISKN